MLDSFASASWDGYNSSIWHARCSLPPTQACSVPERTHQWYPGVNPQSAPVHTEGDEGNDGRDAGVEGQVEGTDAGGAADLARLGFPQLSKARLEGVLQAAWWREQDWHKLDAAG